MDKMYTKKAFKCSICNKEYEDAMDRARCELACGKKQQEEAKKAAEAKKKEMKIADESQVDEAFAAAYKLRDEFVKKYGAYSYVHKNRVTNTFEDDNMPTLGDVLDFLSTIAF